MISRRKSYSWHHQCKRSPISAPFKIEVDIKTPRKPAHRVWNLPGRNGQAFTPIPTIVEVTPTRSGYPLVGPITGGDLVGTVARGI